jgi:hypothetical protein
VSFDDVPALVPAIGNYDVVRWLGRVPYPYRAADAEAFVSAKRRQGRAGLVRPRRCGPRRRDLGRR